MAQPSMQKLTYQVRFLTPAFLGNAEQSGQWRTPPFKALLRQWWRVVWAAENDFREDITAMREDEGRLFGNAWLEGNFRKSAVRIRLSSWSAGQLANSSMSSNSNLMYLGYGPLNRQSTKAIKPLAAATLSIAAPTSTLDKLKNAISLADACGTMGGRSRNGWGSVTFANIAPLKIARFARYWRDAMQLDWPHAIGSDERGLLLWQTRGLLDQEKWRVAMQLLAHVKRDLRKEFPLNERCWLSYPITKYRHPRWGEGMRMPNSLRLKVRADADDPTRLRGTILHMPCSPPADFEPDNLRLQDIWTKAHRFLDAHDVIKRVQE